MKTYFGTDHLYIYRVKMLRRWTGEEFMAITNLDTGTMKVIEKEILLMHKAKEYLESIGCNIVGASSECGSGHMLLSSNLKKMV